MLFNSLEFLLFLPIVFILYWGLQKKLQAQNILVLAASYLFYGWWDWRFLSLIAFSTLIDYYSGISIANAKKQSIKKRWLYLSIATNLGLLGFFKYYNFFVQSWIDAWAGLGYEMDAWTIKVILPVGISFYTFQTLSYTIDIYKGKLKPTKNLIAFGAYVAFFPQLVAGPIERATNLLPQVLKTRVFNYTQARNGLRLILWGMFKKVVIADSLAPIVNNIFANYQDQAGFTLILGAIYFAFQIYCDFSGYSDIAIGTAKLFGIELMSNFKFPYFSRNIAEFWRRWHISLSTWFRDYLYIPLGGSRGSKSVAIRNILIIFIVSGLWHGANWTFVAWGAIHALLFIPLFIGNRNRKYTTNIVAEKSFLPNLKELLQIGVTFIMVCFAWIFFRANGITHAFDYISEIDLSYGGINTGWNYVLVLLVFDWLFRYDERLGNNSIFKKSSALNWALYMGLFMITMSKLFYTDRNIEFIYFQF